MSEPTRTVSYKTVEIDEDLADLLEQEAKRANRTMDEIANDLLRAELSGSEPQTTT